MAGPPITAEGPYMASAPGCRRYQGLGNDGCLVRQAPVFWSRGTDEGPSAAARSLSFRDAVLRLDGGEVAGDRRRAGRDLDDGRKGIWSETPGTQVQHRLIEA